MSNCFTDCLYQSMQPPAVYEESCCSKSLSTFITFSFKNFSRAGGNVELAIKKKCGFIWPPPPQGFLSLNPRMPLRWISEIALLVRWAVCLSLHKTHSLTSCGFKMGLVSGQKFLPCLSEGFGGPWL